MNKEKNIAAIMKVAGKQRDGTEPHFDVNRVLYWDANLKKRVFCNRNDGEVWRDKDGVEIEDDIDYDGKVRAVEVANEIVNGYHNYPDNQIVFKYPKVS